MRYPPLEPSLASTLEATRNRHRQDIHEETIRVVAQLHTARLICWVGFGCETCARDDWHQHPCEKRGSIRADLMAEEAI